MKGRTHGEKKKPRERKNKPAGEKKKPETKKKRNSGLVMKSTIIELYKLMQDAAAFSKFTAEINETVQTIVDKAAYLVIVKQDTVMAWVIKHLVYNIRAGLYDFKYTPNIYDFSTYGIVQFLRTENVERRCGDGCDVLREFKDDMSCLMLVDPPYLLSDNSVYSKGCRDTNIYEHCSDNFITNMQAGVVYVVEDNWIMRMVFKGCVKVRYDKLYEARRKKTQHVIISNL